MAVYTKHILLSNPVPQNLIKDRVADRW